MKRRLAKMAFMMVILPLGVRAAEVVADHLEAERTHTTARRLLRGTSKLGRRWVR
jgi:hypothetical protein